MRLRPLAILIAASGLAVVGLLVVVGGPLRDTPPGGLPEGSGATGSGLGAAETATPSPRPTARPQPGHELYGFIPYWEMDEGIVEHVRDQDLSTIGLFSVTARRDGSLNESARGYRAITGQTGRRLVRMARDRGIRTELVFTSFGRARNERLFGGPVETQDRVIDELVAFAQDNRFDGINVDVEVLDRELIPAYGAFVGRLREALRADDSDAQVSVATTANVVGSEMAAAAAQAGADRIFLMGYDYHWSGSNPGASAPIDRRDGDEKDLVWSLDMYEALGVPVERTLLGLPLYGMVWEVGSPELGAARTARGQAWVPSNNRDFLRRPPVEPVRDDIEVVDVYVVPTDADAEPEPTPDLAGATDGSFEAGSGTWRAIYVDSPETLVPKLRMANERGLAGAGFWAIGFERGLPGYRELFDAFRRDELPAP